VLSQDQHVAGYALEAGKGIVLVVNKIDLVDPQYRKAAAWQESLRRAFKFAPDPPVVVTSAKSGQGIDRILPAALEVVGLRRVRVPTNELNRVLREAFLERPPPSFRGKRMSLSFATQAASETPTFVLFVNDVKLLHFSYRRYLENRIRERFGFAGNPIRIVLRSAKENDS
jgi:GTP-binding protein